MEIIPGDRDKKDFILKKNNSDGCSKAKTNCLDTLGATVLNGWKFYMTKDWLRQSKLTHHLSSLKP